MGTGNLTSAIGGFIKKKGIGFYLQAACVVLAVITAIGYAVAGTDSYGFVPMVVVLLVLGIAAGIVFCIRDFLGLGPVVTMAFYGAAAGVFIYSRFMYYSHQYYGIASDPMSGAMILTTVAFIALIVCSIVGAFFLTDKEGD